MIMATKRITIIILLTFLPVYQNFVAQTRALKALALSVVGRLVAETLGMRLRDMKSSVKKPIFR